MMSIAGPMISELPLESDAMQRRCGERFMRRPVVRPVDRVVVFGSHAHGANAIPQGFLGPARCIETLA